MLIIVVVFFKLFLTFEVSKLNLQTAQSRFDNHVQNSIIQASTAFEVYADNLYYERALLAVKPELSSQDWTNFVDSQEVSRRYPGVSGISYAIVSDDGQRARLTYIAPSSANQGRIGYDLYSDPLRRTALDAARDSGQPRASVPLALISDNDDQLPSIMIALPLYQNSDISPSTIAARRASLSGFVILSLHAKSLLDSIFGSPSAFGTISLNVKTDGQSVYRFGDTPSGKALQKNVKVNVAGQTWSFDFRAPSDYGLSRISRLAPLAIILSSLVLISAIILTFYLASRIPKQ